MANKGKRKTDTAVQTPAAGNGVAPTGTAAPQAAPANLQAHVSASNQHPARVSAPEFGTAGAPPAESPEKVTPVQAPPAQATSPAATEVAPANESEMLDAYWASYGDEATHARLREAQHQPLMEVIIGTDDRRQVGNTSDYPWRCITSLRITAHDGSAWIGTGWLVNRRLLLTAGHCVYMADHGGWVQQIEVIPGRQGDTFPSGSCVATNFRSVHGWIDDGNRDYDYGAIILGEDCRYGDTLGWFGYQVRSDGDLQNLTVNISGYPGDKPAGTQWFLSGTIKSVNDRTFEYDIDTAGGQSGAPVWAMLSDGSRYAVGVHTNGATGGNSATRITQEVFDNVTAWINEAS
jgi:V8-like Glu-specific endopeptidase